MSDEEKLEILNKLDRKIEKLKKSKVFTLGAVLIILISYLVDDAESLLNKNLSTTTSLLTFYYVMNLFMQSRNEILKEKCQDIIEKIDQ